MVVFLIENGADVNAKDIRKRTPLDYAKIEDIKKILQSVGGKKGSDI